MRVSSNTFTDNLLNHLQTLSRRQANLQFQASSGQRIQTADEDPLAMRQVLSLRDNSAATAQFQKNISTNQDFATVTGSALRSLTTIINKAREIATSADDTKSPEALKSYATEVSRLISRAVDIANSKHRDEYLFAGTNSGQAAFTANYDAAGMVTSVDFQGNTDLPETEIDSGVRVASRLAGANTTGSGPRGLFSDDRFGADLFSHLISLQQQLSAGDLDGIQQTTRAQLEADEDNVLYHVADNGALQAHLEAASSENKNEKLALDTEISGLADADLADTMVRLNQTQTNYQAALQSAGSILNLTLLDFLR